MNIDAGSMDVVAVAKNASLYLAAQNQIGQPVDARQQARLAAAGRADQRRDAAVVDVEADVAQDFIFAIAHRKLLDANLRNRLTAGRARDKRSEREGLCGFVIRQKVIDGC